MDIRKLEQMGMEQGFSHVVLLDCDTIELKPEVRQMCASGSCHKYDKCWSCPAGCGFLHQLLSSGIEEQCKGTDCKNQVAVIKLEKIFRRRAEVFLQEELEAGLII